MSLVKQFSQDLINSLCVSKYYIAFVFVDDGSVDDTPQLIHQWVETLQCLHRQISIGFVKLPSNTKKSGMYQTALDYQDARYYLFVDADGSFQIDDIILCCQLSQTHDVVITYKGRNDSRTYIRRFATCIHNLITQITFNGSIKDTQTGLKIFSREVARLTFHYIRSWHGFASDFVLIYEIHRLGLSIIQTPVNLVDRDGSHVKLLSDGLRYSFIIISIILFNRVIPSLKRSKWAK